MNELINRICDLIQADNVRVSRHAFRRLQKHGIETPDLLEPLKAQSSLRTTRPTSPVRPFSCYTSTAKGDLIHAVWGIAHDTDGPAVLITANRPDPELWSSDFRSRNEGWIH